MGTYVLIVAQLKEPCLSEVGIPYTEAIEIGYKPKTFEAIKEAKSFCEEKHCREIRDCGAYKAVIDLHKGFSIVDKKEQRKKFQAVA